MLNVTMKSCLTENKGRTERREAIYTFACFLINLYSSRGIENERRRGKSVNERKIEKDERMSW